MQCKHHIPVKWLILHRHSAYIPITVADMKKNYTTIISSLLAISKLHPNHGCNPLKIHKIFSGNQPWLQHPPQMMIFPATKLHFGDFPVTFDTNIRVSQ